MLRKKIACTILAIVASIAGSAYAAETISGQITASGSGTPLGGVDLDVFDDQGAGVSIQNGISDPAGDYTLTLPGPGTYIVRADASAGDGYADQYHDHVFLPSLSTQIVVNSGQSITGIDFALTAGVDVSGTIRSTSTNAPLGSIDMDLYSLTGESLGGYPAVTAVDGTYVIGPLPPGQYYLRADPSTGLGQFFVRTYYGGANDIALATPITVGTSDLTGIDIDLSPGGLIAGNISELGSGTPLAGIDLDLYDSTGVRMQQGDFTDAAGNYEIGPVPPGSYFLRADPTIAQGYPHTYFDGVYSSALATAVSVTESFTTSGIDFVLAPGGTISGNITDTSNIPLSGIDLDCYDASGSRVSVDATTDALGNFQIGPLAPGDYHLRADPAPLTGYARQYYNGKISVATADPITVTALADTPNIDFALDAAGTISGQVSDDGVGVPNIDIDILQAGTFVRLEQNTSTDANGYFTLTALPPGSYIVRADPTSSQFYQRTYFGGVPVQEAATPITVLAGQNVTAIDIAFEPGLPAIGPVGISIATGLLILLASWKLVNRKRPALSE